MLLLLLGLLVLLAFDLFAIRGYTARHTAPATRDDRRAMLKHKLANLRRERRRPRMNPSEKLTAATTDACDKGQVASFFRPCALNSSRETFRGSSCRWASSFFTAALTAFSSGFAFSGQFCGRYGLGPHFFRELVPFGRGLLAHRSRGERFRGLRRRPRCGTSGGTIIW